MESVSCDERPEFDLLRQRVRASRRATSAPLLVFGVVTLLFACYEGFVNYSFVPLPLYWPLGSLVALLVLASLDRLRRQRSGVGAGRFPYRQATAVLVVILLLGNIGWFFPLVGMLLWPATVLTVLALRQRNRPLAVRAGTVAAVLIVGRLVGEPVSGAWFDPALRAGGGAALLALGLMARAAERTIE